MTKSIIYYMLLNFPMILYFFMIMLMLIPMKSNKLHPLFMIIILIMMTFLISFKMILMFKSWMNFILMLIMIGALLIIFMYIASLINNELFIFNFKNIYLYLMKFFLMIILMYLIFKYSYNFELFSNLNNKLMNLFLEKKNEMILSELYNFNKFILMFIMIYLYFSMICIMNICYKLKTPLRQLYFYYE